VVAIFGLQSPAGASLTVGLVGLVVFLVVVRLRAAGVLLVIALLPFHKFAIALLDHTRVPLPDVPPDIQLQVYTTRVYLLDAAIIGGLILGALVVATTGPPGPLSRRRLLAFVLAINVVALTAIAALLGGPMPRAAGFSLLLDIGGPLTLLAVLCVQPDRQLILRARGWVLASVTVIAVVALAEQLSTTALPTWIRADTPQRVSAFYVGVGTDYRSGSLLATPLELSFLFAAAIPLALGAAAGTGRTARGLGTVSLGIIAAGLAVTFTRSGYLGAAAGLAAVLVLGAPGWRRNIISVTAVAVAATLLVVAIPRISDLHLAHGSGNDVAHFTAMRNDVQLIQQRPLGHGLGVIDSVGQLFGSSNAVAVSSENEFLAKGVEGGIPAMVLYALSTLGVLAALGSTSVAARRRGDADLTRLAAGAFGSILALAVSGVFLGADDLSFLCMTWAFSGAALAQPRWERRREARRLRERSAVGRLPWAPPIPGQPIS
jgi:hypothetical protein